MDIKPQKFLTSMKPFPLVEKSVCGDNFGPSVGSPATNGFTVDFGLVSDV